MVVWGERLLEGLLVFGQKLDVQLVGVFHEVPARIPLTFGELVEELLEADFDPRHQNRFIAAGNRDPLVDGQLECLPDIRKHRLFLPRPAAGIGRWTAFRAGRKRALIGRGDAIADRHLAVSAAGIETLSQETPLALAHPTHCILPV